MKRKTIPFPSSTMCSIKSTVMSSSFPSTSSKGHQSPLVATLALEEKIILPHSHDFSLSLLSDNAVTELASNHPEGLLSWRLLLPGLLEVNIQSGKENGYGYTYRSWPFRIGGVGLIYDEFSAPVAVRCAVPIAHCHIDDAGFFNATFWKDDTKDISSEPTLLDIVERLIIILSSDHHKTLVGDRYRYWTESEAHCHQKVSVIGTYRSLALCPSLVCQTGSIKLEWLAPDLRNLAPTEWHKFVNEVSPGVFSFDLFSADFCDLLVAEVDNFEATTLPRRRPNTMNKFGLILNEIGMEPIMTELLAMFIEPLCRDLYPHENVAVGLDHHHSFVVVYSQTGDKGLDMHHDASEVTLNVCLGREFEGSGLVFCGQAGRPDHRKHRHIFSHKKGRAILHLGRQRHGADNISSGERMNLIMWARSSAFRCGAVNGTVSPDGFPRQTEDGTPDKMCLSHSNDGDYTQQMQIIAAAAAVVV